MLTFLVAVLLSVVLADAGDLKIGATVKTTSGDITGQPSSWKPEVSEYLGIPYAEAPVGKRRFAAPVAFKAAGRAVNATKYGPSCLATIPSDSASMLSAMGVEMGPQSEDCLYINVWTKPQTGEKKKAVMIWIDGRGFVVGDSSNKAYNGALLADEHDVVVVNMNYRLGVLGFANAYYMKDINFGLHDQRRAVEWVRDNIEAFGGDPKRITLFGQSAGSSSIDYYVFAWAQDPIAHAFILQSGTAGLLDGTANSANWFMGTKTLGCVDSPGTATAIDCMRSKSSEEIMGAYSGISFGPSTDSKFFYKDYRAPLAAGKFAQKPTLVGHTESEWDSYKRRSIFPAYDAPTATTNETAIKKVYESFLICNVARLAKARVERKIPTWVYSYAGDFPNQKTSPNMTTGPWHGSEVGLIFGTTEFTRKLPDTQEQAELGKKMREAWTSFAKAPVTGLDELKWPRYNPSASTVVTLGGKNNGKITFTSAARYAPSCKPLRIMEQIFGF